MCCMSRVLSHIPCVTCHVSQFFSFLLDKVVELVGGGSVIKGAYSVFFRASRDLWPSNDWGVVLLRHGNITLLSHGKVCPGPGL